MSAEIEWADPPEHPQGRWAGIADELRATPGRWAKVRKATTDVSFARRVRLGHMSGFGPEGSFEVRTVNVGDPRAKRPQYDIYVRYLGGDQ